MSNKTFTATITWPEEKIRAFAERRGYSEMIPNPKRQNINLETGEVTINDEEPEMIPNTKESLESFIAEKFTEFAVQFFMQDASNEIDIAINSEAENKRKEQKTIVATQIKSAITVNWN